MGVLSAFGQFSQVGVGWGAHVLSNTKYFNVLLEVGGGAWPPLGTHMTYYPYSSPYLLLPLLYYSPGAWSEVTSMVTYVMMTNSLIHYCQSMKHIYRDTVYKLS